MAETNELDSTCGILFNDSQADVTIACRISFKYGDEKISPVL